MENNIVLTGFMGSGKSTVGKAIADRLGLEFYDLDLYIEQSQNIKISEIFKNFGEEHFRNLETLAVAELSGKGGVVISCGGGTVLRKENVKMLKANGKIFYLEVDAETVIKRLGNDSSRPLLQKENKCEEITRLLNIRKPIYEVASDYKIDAACDIKNIVDKIIELSF